MKTEDRKRFPGLDSAIIGESVTTHSRVLAYSFEKALAVLQDQLPFDEAVQTLKGFMLREKPGDPIIVLLERTEDAAYAPAPNIRTH